MGFSTAVLSRTNTQGNTCMSSANRARKVNVVEGFLSSDKDPSIIMMANSPGAMYVTWLSVVS